METEKEFNNWQDYWHLGLTSVKQLETEKGILASGKNEIYGAIFGRDSLITALKLLKVYQKTKIKEFLPTVRKVLLTLAELQGKEENIESGEEPGKCIHEYRTENHEHLTKRLENPWYLYPDNTMRNYDSVDSTPLFLITLYRYYQITKDREFIELILPNVKAAINWMIDYSDLNNDGLVDFALKQNRKFGGLKNQNWMDSSDSFFHEDGKEVVYPLAPVETQAYSFLALKLWSKYFTKRNPVLSELLFLQAYQLKTKFNEKFVIEDESGFFLASAVDGVGEPLKSVRSSIGHCLWASLTIDEDGELESIVERELIGDLVKRLMMEDMFVPGAGIRTLSSKSTFFKPNSYHNGSIWPFDNSIVAEGFENFGFLLQAQEVRSSILKAINHFKTPVELFVYDDQYLDYLSSSGQTSCKQQAWTAAAILRSVAGDYKDSQSFSSRFTLFRAGTRQTLNLLGEKFYVKLKLKPKEAIGKLKEVKAEKVLEVLLKEPN